jgi:D-alanine transfer protein
MPADAKKEMPHLFSGLIACCVVAAGLVGTEMVAIHLEQATIHSTAPELFSLKNQGLAFQRAAACAPNVMPLYASSELTALQVPEKASNFFRNAPTGFQVSPVGAGGMAPLNILQKVGALGSDLHGKRFAISLSPGLTTNPGCKSYDGNFSLMAASEMVFGTVLGSELKRQIAARMLECPSNLEKSPLLEFAVRLLASGRWFDRVAFYALWPVGKVQNTVLEMQDHFAALGQIAHRIQPAPSQRPETLDWRELISKVSALKPTNEDKPEEPSSLHEQLAPGSSDAAFRNRMDTAPGWTDLELLLRTLARVHARPLLLSMPFDGESYDETGISRSGRDSYYKRLHALAQRYHFALVEFKGHDEDPAFLYLHRSHLTAKGWVYYDRALDDFYHGRSPQG